MTFYSATSTYRHARLILHPRRSGRLYDVEYDGNLIVRGSRDPEPHAARALAGCGVSGRAVTVDGRTGTVRMAFSIEAMARLSTVERGSRSVRFEPYRQRPSEIAAVASGTGISGSADRGR